MSLCGPCHRIMPDLNRLQDAGEFAVSKRSLSSCRPCGLTTDTIWLFLSPHSLKGGSTMEPRKDEQKTTKPETEQSEAKPRRFRLVRLEERIAPGGGNHTLQDVKKCVGFTLGAGC